MSSGNYKDLTPDDNYASVDLTGDSIALPPDAEDIILVVEGDSSISGTVNVELEHSNDNVNFTTAKNKPLSTGAGAPSAPTIEAYFSRMPNPRVTAGLRLGFTNSSGQSSISSVYLGELILNAMDASNPNGTYRIEITGPDAQYVEFRATNENARASFLDNFENESLDTLDATFVNVQDPSPTDGVDHMSFETVFDFTSPQQYLAYTGGNSSENKFNAGLKLRDSSHQIQQGHIITGINFKNKVELHTKADEGNYLPSFTWLKDNPPLNWGNNTGHMGVDRGINIQLTITPEFGANPTPVTITNPFVIRGVPVITASTSSLPHTASIGDSFGSINIGSLTSTISGLPALDYEITCHDSRVALSGSTAQAGTSLTATLNTGFSPFGGLNFTAGISAKEPTKGLTSFDDTSLNYSFIVTANPLSVTAGTVTSPSSTAALGDDVCSVSVAGGLGTESISLTVAGADASYYQLNNITTATTGSTITATSTDTVVLETNQAFTFGAAGYTHNVDINASFTDSYGTYTDSVSVQTTQASSFLNSSAVGTNVSNTGVDLGIYQGAMDPAKLGAYTSSDVAQWTISFWAKTANSLNTAQKGVAVRTYGQSTSNNYEATDIQLSNSQILIGGTRTASHYKAVNVSGGTTDWHHYVVRYSTGGSWLYKLIDIYVDGVVQGSSTSVYINFWLDMWSATTNKTIAVCGRYNSISTNYAWGSQGTGTSYDIELYVDELSFWNTALTGTQIAALYNNGTPTNLTGSANLARWFRFGDFASDTGTSIVDTQNTSESLTGSTDYRVTLTSSDSIKIP